MKPKQSEITIIDKKIASIKTSFNYSKIIIKSKNQTQEYVFKDGFVYPGFTDSHGHIFALGTQLNGLNLNNAKSAEECIELCKTKPFFKGSWLVGRGWNNELWDNDDYPNLQLIDSAFPDIPVCLIRVDGHAAWVNSVALRLAKIDKMTKDVDGGLIIKDGNGRSEERRVGKECISRWWPEH